MRRYWSVAGIGAAVCIGMAAAADIQLPEHWADQWNPEVGLWRSQGGGHTAPVSEEEFVHPAPSAAARLLSAALVGRLDELDAPAVLKALREMQVTDETHGQHGCLQWYWEEPGPVDTNAAFFTGLNLIVLRLGFEEQLAAELDAEAGETLDAILTDLSAWFDTTLENPSRYYPNKYMGDLVCRWLLIEALDQTDEMDRVAEEMLESAAYWRDENWGWGEHMSNIYARVLLDQTSILLLLSENLPGEVREAFTGLRDELLAIEDAYAGPRVPVIRDYSFTQSPTHTNYRDGVTEPQASGDLAAGNLAIQPVLAVLGWHDAVPERAEPETDITVPCYDGVEAIARVEESIRLGTLTRFPLMPDMERPTWGLSWQSFPVAAWRREGGWGFLQWESEKEGERRAHPSGVSFREAYLHNAITFSKEEPIVGRTYAVQEGGHALVLRVMPELYAPWEGLTDRFRWVDGDADVHLEEQEGPWSQMLLDFGDAELSVHHISLDGHQPAFTEPSGGPWDWSVRRGDAELGERDYVASVWALSLGGRVDTPPELHETGEDDVWRLNWDMGGGRPHWRVRIAPRASKPLRAE